MSTISINDASDYIILRLRSEGGSDLNHLKLQKLLYYCQSWYLAFYNERLFNGRFQAWIHGPVNRAIYNRFNDTKYMYSDINVSDVLNPSVESELPRKAKRHIDSILDSYAKYSPTQLEEMTHKEQPWLDARGDLAPNQRCDDVIDENLMRKFYKKRLD